MEPAVREIVVTYSFVFFVVGCVVGYIIGILAGYTPTNAKVDEDDATDHKPQEYYQAHLLCSNCRTDAYVYIEKGEPIPGTSPFGSYVYDHRTGDQVVCRKCGNKKFHKSLFQ